MRARLGPIAIAVAGALLAAAAGPAAAVPPPLIVIPALGQSPERQARDSRICEVWAARKSGATSSSGFVDVLDGSVSGFFDGWDIGTMTGRPETGAIVGLGVGAAFGAAKAMNKQGWRTWIYADCMRRRGYRIG